MSDGSHVTRVEDARVEAIVRRFYRESTFGAWPRVEDSPVTDTVPQTHFDPLVVQDGSSDEFRKRVREELVAFLTSRASEARAQAAAAGELVELALDFVQRGKYARPTFAYLGWLSCRDESRAALRAAASLELLHAFALIQDDVMDASVLRRGQPTVHTELQRRHTRDGDSRFGESAAVVLGDLCLIWAEQMLRTSGLDAAALQRAAPVYDLMRQELAIGQYLDLHHTNTPTHELATAWRIAHLKSARYTVTRPLLLGAQLAGGEPYLHSALQAYGDAVGLAFQLRDDILGVIGDTHITGKPADDDLREGKPTTVLAAAFELADDHQRKQLHAVLDRRKGPERGEELRALIVATGAVEHVERLISEQALSAADVLDYTEIPERVRTQLKHMIDTCAHRNS